MSYSLTTGQPDKATALADLMRQFDQQVMVMFPLHASDRAAVQANLNAALGVLASDDSKTVNATLSGFITTENGVVVGVGISATCSHGVANTTTVSAGTTGSQVLLAGGPTDTVVVAG